MFEGHAGRPKPSGIERAAESAHHLRTVAAENLAPGQPFESPHHGVVAHRAALHDDPAAHLVGRTELQHLVKAVLYDRVRKPGSDIGHRSSLAQHLLHAGVHKNGAARPQVAGMGGGARLRRELPDPGAEAPGEGLDERTAARRTSFVDLHARYGAVLDENGLHVLSADVEDTIHVRFKESGSIVMSHCLNFAFIQHKCRLHQCFAVTC